MSRVAAIVAQNVAGEIIEQQIKPHVQEWAQEAAENLLKGSAKAHWDAMMSKRSSPARHPPEQSPFTMRQSNTYATLDRQTQRLKRKLFHGKVYTGPSKWAKYKKGTKTIRVGYAKPKARMMDWVSVDTYRTASSPKNYSRRSSIANTYSSYSTPSRRSSIDAVSGSQFSYSPYSGMATYYKRPFRRRFTKRRFIRKRYGNKRPFSRFRRYSKGKQLANRVFSKARKIYNKKTKSQRIYNNGKLSLTKNMSTGGRLPFESSMVMFFRMQDEATFQNVGFSNRDRTVRMNALRYPIANQPALANSVQLNRYQWMDTVRSLYSEYCITGAKLLVEIKPTIWPAEIITAGKTLNLETGTIGSDYAVPLGSTSGYWYIRVHYRKKDQGGFADANMAVGANMNTPVVASLANVGTERIWRTRREFLSDPTVSYVRDRTLIREKIKGSIQSQLGIGSQANGSVQWTDMNANDTQRVEYEIEKNNKTVYLKQFFSYKKHYGDKNWRNNISWHSLGTDDATVGEPPYEQTFFARVGYVGFNAAGTLSFHTPIDRIAQRNVTFSMTARVRLRKPKIGPDGVLGTVTPQQLQEMALMVEAESRMPKYPRQTEEEKEETKFELDSLQVEREEEENSTVADTDEDSFSEESQEYEPGSSSAEESVHEEVQDQEWRSKDIELSLGKRPRVPKIQSFLQ